MLEGRSTGVAALAHWLVGRHHVLWTTDARRQRNSGHYYTLASRYMSEPEQSLPILLHSTSRWHVCLRLSKDDHQKRSLCFAIFPTFDLAQRIVKLIQ